MNFGPRFPWVFVFLFNLVLFISCSKDEVPYDPPSIQWIEPQENKLLNAGDTVRLKLNIKDDQAITLVKITLKNEQHVPVLDLPDIRPNRNDYLVDVDFALSNLDLNGSYYFDVTAHNASSSMAAFRYVQLLAKRKVFSNLLLIEAKSNSTLIHTWRADTLSFFKELKGDFLNSNIDLKGQQLFMSGRYTGDFVSVSLVDTGINWQVPSLAPPQVPYFNTFSIHDDLITLSLHDGRLFGFQKSGLQTFDQNMGNGFRPGQSAYFDPGFLAVERLDKSSSNKHFQFLHYPSGSAKASHATNFGEIKALFRHSNNEILMFSNQDSKVLVLIYHINEDFIETKGTYALGHIQNAIAAEDAFNILNVDGDVYKVGADLKPVKITSDGDVLMLRYNLQDQSIWCLTKTQIEVIDSKGNPLTSINLPFEMASMELNFN